MTATDAVHDAYGRFLPPDLVAELWDHAEEVPGLPHLRRTAGLGARHPVHESADALAFVRDLYLAMAEPLGRVLQQRARDRAFIDREGAACTARNAAEDRGVAHPDYETVIGRRDGSGRVVVGPHESTSHPAWQAPVPAHLSGYHITLFGPPDSARMAVNAMNAIHRTGPAQGPWLQRLVTESGVLPMWGADTEDSKTPLAFDMALAADNLRGCFDGTIAAEANGKRYELAASGLSQPIKRFVGLALPDPHHLHAGQPLPLHLSDFALHLFHNRSRPRALTFYVPKLENEEEAAYLAQMFATAERLLEERDPDYAAGHIRCILVFENPRAIFRIREMAYALRDYFIGGSLGWHDYLASTARLFKTDPDYRIPVKADPDIVIKHIKESHQILATTLGAIGAKKIGGMYGVLYESGNARSYQVSLAGFIRDVVTQLRRGLDGFWIAHPDFVGVGIALTEAWRRYAEGDEEALRGLVDELLGDAPEKAVVTALIGGDDVPGLDPSDPRYPRSLLACDLAESSVVSNSDPEEVRYNVFQALQYLADWLSGNGCVALPATLRAANGAPTFVRIMDDLATTERSRWEVWAELHHGRISRALFDTILDEEIAFIKAGQDDANRRVQVPWSGEAALWYPIAVELLRKLMTDPEPAEFVTELLMPYATELQRERVRAAAAQLPR